MKAKKDNDPDEIIEVKYAYDEIIEFLEDKEEIENIVFNTNYFTEDIWDFYLPKKYIGSLLSLKEARPYLYGWKIGGGYGGEEVIPFYIWTNKRILFIGCYDGSTWLTSVPRHPKACQPDTVGGG